MGSSIASVCIFALLLTAHLVSSQKSVLSADRADRRLAPPGGHPCGHPQGDPCPTAQPTGGPGGPGPKPSPSPVPSSAPTTSSMPTSDVVPPRCMSVDDCMGNMTLAEKIGQMTQIEKNSLNADGSDIANYNLGSLLSGGGGSPEEGNTPEDWANMIDQFQHIALTQTRLGIPLLYGVDAVHGHSNVFGATIFPHNIGLGATRNPALLKSIGEITAKETRATGIPWTFAPCLCVSRDERWGRSYECFGETADLVKNMTAIIDGLQGDTTAGSLETVEHVLATAKHWIADGGTDGGVDRGDAILFEAQLRSIHMPPYVDAIGLNVGSVMPSYSSINGTKMHGNKYLLTDVLKDELGFDGVVVSDWQAIEELPGDYGSQVSAAINAGNDLIMVPYDYQRFQTTLEAEIVNGNIDEARINNATRKILQAKFDLGLFEPPYGKADRTYINDIGKEAHRQVARQAVRESLVLLKDDTVLPLSLNPTTPFKIVVAGKSANDIGNQCGGWTITWQGSSGDTTPGDTVYEAVQDLFSSQTNVDIELNENPSRRVTGDLGIVVVGERPYAEGQGDDQHLGLDGGDDRAIMNVCRNMDCVVVLISGRPMLIEKYIDSADVNAFVAAWLPGTEGKGIVDVLFQRDGHGFSGKLPVTWPRNMDQIPINADEDDYDARDKLFKFGYGLTPY